MCKVIYTAHDHQLICPNHLCYNEKSGTLCQKCLGGHFLNCIQGRCIHGSIAKSAVGTAEAYFWKANGVYRYIDTIVCCSYYLKSKMDTNPLFAQKTVALHNFVDCGEGTALPKENYALYFGRFSKEKGVETILEVCKALPNVSFVFAGTGPMEEKLNELPNVRNVGFQSGKALENLIRQARFTICPSECYENCPFSVMESQLYGTPVLGARIGGIPELIEEGVTGELFTSGNAGELKERIQKLWQDKALTDVYAGNCRNIRFDTVAEYTEKLMKIYGGTNR